VTWPLFQVDAFCAEPFAGNPAEMNLSETAFLLPGDGPGA
jgi:predicted PhzF superfamily epimerase YddE/YHI9